MARRYGIQAERPLPVLVGKTNFCTRARRRLAGRTFAWLNANRRLSEVYDRSMHHANAWIGLANIRRVLKLR